MQPFWSEGIRFTHFEDKKGTSLGGSHVAAFEFTIAEYLFRRSLELSHIAGDVVLYFFCKARFLRRRSYGHLQASAHESNYTFHVYCDCA